MDMLEIFHMNKGVGEASYAQNCTVQNTILSITKPFVEEAIQETFGTNFPETLTIADLGCSSGPNALRAVSEIIDVVANTRSRWVGHRSWWPKFMVFLNDLPGNDFNEVFASLSGFHKKLKEEKGADFGPCFIAGLPGSFYDKLLPSQILHFVYSSSSLHWLSQVPPGLDANDQSNEGIINKGEIYISKTSPRSVIDAYLVQFQRDFLAFLRCRAEEVISGGCMVLAFMGRSSNDPTSQQASYPWDFIARSLMTLVSEGLIEEEKVDSFNVPYYAPSIEELKHLVEEEGSFLPRRLETIELDWDGSGNSNTTILQEENKLGPTRGERVAKMHRAVVESMLAHHFGSHILDDLFFRYTNIVDDHLSKYPDSKLINVVVSLVRK